MHKNAKEYLNIFNYKIEFNTIKTHDCEFHATYPEVSQYWSYIETDHC